MSGKRSPRLFGPLAVALLGLWVFGRWLAGRKADLGTPDDNSPIGELPGQGSAGQDKSEGFFTRFYRGLGEKLDEVLTWRIWPW